MIVTYMRSSSYGAWDWCPHKYFLSFVLGYREGSGKKADKGNVTHKALEILGRKKLATQNGDSTFRDEESDRDFSTKEVSPELAIEWAYRYYTQIKSTQHEWKPADLRDCTKWMWNNLNYNDGMFSPLKRHVLQPEQYFDFEIDRPWANYSYTLPDGSKLDGRLALKGTVDLVTLAQPKPKIIEYIDFKTGKRIDWATGKEKTYEKLCDDPQLRMYHMALDRLYPDADEIFVTIFYCQDGGPFSICFTKADLPRTEEIIRARFEEIRDNTQPSLIYGDPEHGWKCHRLCHFNKMKVPKNGKTFCHHIRDEIVALGMNRVLQVYGQDNAFAKYGDGGGRSGSKTGR